MSDVDAEVLGSEEYDRRRDIALERAGNEVLDREQNAAIAHYVAMLLEEARYWRKSPGSLKGTGRARGYRSAARLAYLNGSLWTVPKWKRLRYVRAEWRAMRTREAEAARERQEAGK